MVNWSVRTRKEILTRERQRMELEIRSVETVSSSLIARLESIEEYFERATKKTRVAAAYS